MAYPTSNRDNPYVDRERWIVRDGKYAYRSVEDERRATQWVRERDMNQTIPVMKTEEPTLYQVIIVDADGGTVDQFVMAKSAAQAERKALADYNMVYETEDTDTLRVFVVSFGDYERL